MADLNPIVRTGQISLYYKSRPSGSENSTLSLNIINTTPIAEGPITYWFDADLVDGGINATINDIAAAELRLYYTEYADSEEAAPGLYATSIFPITLITTDTQSSTVYSYRPDLLGNASILNGTWEKIQVQGSDGRVDYEPAKILCTDVGSGNFSYSLYYKTNNVVESFGLCNPTYPSELQTVSIYFPLLNGLSTTSSLQDVANAGVVLYKLLPGPTYTNIAPGYYSLSQFPSTTEDNNTIIKLLNSSVSSATAIYDNEIYSCNQILASPTLPVRSINAFFTSADFVSLSCPNDNEITIYYQGDEVNNVFDLAIDGRNIWITEEVFPEGVLPGYWELIIAPQGVYGNNPYQAFLWYESNASVIGYDWFAINPNPTGFIDLFINPELIQTVYGYNDYNTINCDIEEGVYVRSIELYYANSLNILINDTYANINGANRAYFFYRHSEDVDLSLMEIAERQLTIYTSYYGAGYELQEFISSSTWVSEIPGLAYEFDTERLSTNSAWRARGEVTASFNYNYPYLYPDTYTFNDSINNLKAVSNPTVGPKPWVDYENDYCIRYKRSINIGYRRTINTPQFTLEDIVKYNIPITEKHPVLNSFYPFTVNVAIGPNDTTHYLYKVTDDIPRYIGLNENGDNVSTNIFAPISCDVFELPENNIEVLSDGEGIGVFYAFKTCAQINGAQRVYMVYGNHTNETEEDQRGEIYDFVTEIGLGSTFYTHFWIDDTYDFLLNNQLVNTAKTYIHTVVASSPQSARNILVQNGYDFNDILFVDPYVLGLSGISIATYYNGPCFECINTPYTSSELKTFIFNEQYVIEEKTNSVRLDHEKNYVLDNVSKPLLRTNPKLSSNIKLVIDSSDNLYFDSINATKDLADSKYKAYPINASGSYSYDISRFWNDNKTPYEMAYAVKRDSSDFSVLTDYSKQFEDEYQYGTRFNTSKQYDENFRIFAPIWLDLNVPSKFLIYRINGPTPSLDFKDTASDTESRVDSMLMNSTLIKVFDLSDNSNVGQYIRNHVNDNYFPNKTISVSFEKNEQTLFNGIDIERGGFTEKGEFIYKDFVYDDKTLIESNDFITDAFRRNRLVSANLMNIEFMFDDPDAEEFTVNRYIGIYADSIPSGRGEISSIYNGLVKFSSLESYMDSDNISYAIPSSDMLKNTRVLGYISSKTGYSNIKNGSYYNPDNYNVKLADTMASINNYSGITDTGKSISIKKNEAPGFDFVKFTVKDTPVDLDQITVVQVKREAYRLRYINHVPLNANDSININLPVQSQIFFNSGNNIDEGLQNIVDAIIADPISLYFSAEIEEIKDENGERIKTVVIKERQIGLMDVSLTITRGNPSSVIRVDKLSNSVNTLDNTFIADSNLDAGRINDNYFSSNGTPGQIAMAITSCINKKDNFRAINNGADVYVISKASGYRLMQSALLLNTTNVANFIEILNLDINNELDLDQNALSKYLAYTFNGGNSAYRSALISKDSLGAISVGELLPTTISGKYTKVLDIVDNIDDINGNYSKLIFDKNSDLKDGEYKVFSSFMSEIGLFACYDFYDMDFDFYDTSNSDLKELSLETLDNTAYTPANDPNLLESELINSDYFKQVDLFFSNILPVLNQESTNVGDVQSISSEYDRLNENYVKELSTVSRVVPTINKFVLEGCKTVRNNPYYLNTNEAFGRTNFSPDISLRRRDPLGFTHEWFYIANLPKYFTYDNVNSSFSYINFIKDVEITKDVFLSSEFDYFDRYMISDGFMVEVEDDPDNEFDNFDIFSKTQLDKKYSIFSNGSNLSFSSTFFNGIKVLIKKKKQKSSEATNEFIQDSSFNGYKFSTLVKFNTGATSNNITYDVIKNDVFKFILIYIEVHISDNYIDGNVNRRLIYTLDNKLKLSGDNFVYDDVTISGALIFSGINFNTPGPYEIGAVTHVDGSEPNLDIQLAVLDGDVYGDIEIDYGIEDVNGNPVIYRVNVSGVKAYNKIIVTGPPTDSNGNELDPTYIPYSLQLNAKYTYVGGGKNTHKYFLPRLGAGEVASLLNENDSKINYITVDVNGNLSNGDFVINFEQGNEIIKKSTLISIEDTDKPSTYSLFNGTIGYSLSNRNAYYPFLIRHSGNYTVSLKPVLTFTDVYTHHKINREYFNPLSFLLETELSNKMYKHSISSEDEINRSIAYYKKYNRVGIAFNIGHIQGSHDNSWATIKNHFYHKVNQDNPTGVTKLSESSEYLPVYPLIGEIAIDKTDINILRSSWENDYYIKSISGGVGSKIPGTASTKETRSYLASTLMKVKDSYTFIDFDFQVVSTKANLEQILKQSSNDKPVVIFENDNTITLDFYISDSIVEKFVGLGVLNEINKYVNPEFSEEDKTSIVDDAELYVKNNLISIFSVDLIELYVSKRKDVSSALENVGSIDLIDNGTFIKDDSFSIIKHNNSSINFRLIYNKSLGYSYIMRPLIKIKK